MATVPYLQGRIGSSLPPKYVYGSGRLNPRATALGIRNTLRTLRGAVHIPFESNAAYADTTFRVPSAIFCGPCWRCLAWW